MAQQKRLPKTKRAPEAIAPKRITERSIDVVRAIARYRFIPTSTLLRIVGGNEDVTHRHLQHLYHAGVISRFTIPNTTHRGEFIYFLDNLITVRELAPRLGIDVDWEQLRANRERYSEEALSDGSDGVGQFLFLRHELMIGDFRAALECACRISDGRVELARWLQGPALWSNVQVAPRRTLPHRPDALLTLLLPSAHEGQQRANFFYEADRNTTALPRFKQKVEAYMHHLKQRKHEALDIKRIRAVLVETTTDERIAALMTVVAAFAASEPLAGVFFWFATAGKESDSPFTPRWVCAGDSRVRSLLD